MINVLLEKLKALKDKISTMIRHIEKNNVTLALKAVG